MATGAWLLWLLFVAVYDFRQRRVPNWLVAAGIGGALLVLASDIQPFGVSWSDALAASALGFGALLVFYIVKLMGAGDVKFVASLGLWIGVQPLIEVWLAASLLAALHAAAWWFFRSRPLWPWLAQVLLYPPSTSLGAQTQSTRQKPIPYAAYLAMAALGWATWR